jgi:methionyl-tRNA synthetase
MEKFYITTAIYYVNDKPHIGSVSEAIAADVIARYKRLKNFDVFFSTGTDEHAQKIEERAKKEGISPQEFVDRASNTWKEIFKEFNISYDRFIRTSDKDHVEVVKHFFQKLYEKGDIYLGMYEGWYCVRDATFLKDTDLVDGKCPICGGPVQKIKEPNYFFKLSKYQLPLLKYYEEHKDFLQPSYRYNEVTNVIKSGLQDVSVSRRSFKFGTPVPSNPDHTIYVWFDALLNYLTTIGFLHDNEKFNKYWPADIHLIGKDITRFHGIIWPAMLMSYGLPLPKTIFAHGFWNLEGEKMSKSKGNVVNPVDFVNEFSRHANINVKTSVDVLRYYLSREVTFGQDGNFKMETFLSRYNSDLANDFGNLLNRTVSMLYKYMDGIIPNASIDIEVANFIKEQEKIYFDEMDTYSFSTALEALWDAVNYLNNYIQIKAPWKLRNDKEALSTVLYSLLEGIRHISVLLSPVMPSVSDRIVKSISKDNLGSLEWNILKSGTKVEKIPPVFPRIEKEKINIEKKEIEEKSEEKSLIEYDDFEKLDLRVAKIIEAEKVEKSKKLIKLRISLGGEERTIVGGIALHYSPEELIGKKIIIIKNLKPRKLMGITSQGMLLAASNDEEFSLLNLDRDVKEGSKIS